MKNKNDKKKNGIGARFGTALMGALLGMAISSLTLSSKAAQAWLSQRPVLESMIDVGAIVLFALIFFIFSPSINRSLGSVSKKIEQRLSVMPATDVVCGAIGLVFGLIVAYFISSLFRGLQSGSYLALSALVYIALGVFCSRTASKRWRELNFMKAYRDDDTSFSEFINRLGSENAPSEKRSDIKLLDSSVLIDGRVFSVCSLGFLEGELVIPSFILDELQKLSDSADDARRKKGRRGLDIAAKLGSIESITLVSGVYDDASGDPTDTKLLKLAKKLGAAVVTNDHNLKKVAELTDIRVLNINELAGALRTQLSEGDMISVNVVREGKELGQGVAFMEDGTMIVIDGGKAYVGKKTSVCVTGVIQTGAGRMIFAKLAENP